MLNSYLDFKFDVLHGASNDKNADDNDKGLVNLGPNAFLSTYELTTGPGKHLEDTGFAHIVSLMYKLLTSSGDSNDLSIGFDRNRGRRQRELKINKSLN